MKKALLISTALFICSFNIFAADNGYTWQSLNVRDLEWDDEVGLWKYQHEGFTEGEQDRGAVHDSRFATGSLLLAARYGLLDDPRIEIVLKNLQSMQDQETGFIRHRYTDEGIADYNIAFFVSRKMLLLRKVYWEQFTPNSREIIDSMLQTFYKAFYNESLKDSASYPNKYLGDLVCAKLMQEMYDVPQEEVDKLNRRMLQAARYWTEHNWGWGEHMSDIYVGTCLDLLSLYLLFANETGSRVYAEYKQLFNDLMYIEDMYEGGPRTPVIRSYSFRARGMRTSYRNSIREWESSMGRIGNHFWRAGALMSAIFYEQDWNDRLETEIIERKSPVVRIPCFGDTEALSYILDDIRIGAMSEFPIMGEAENIPWGIGWQSFPVAMWRPDGDWGFLQWQTVEDEQIKAHPASVRTGARALTNTINPPIYGKTYSLQQGGDFLIVRIMPAIAQSWEKVSDIFKIADCTADIIDVSDEFTFNQLLLEYPERTVSVASIPMREGIEAVIEEDSNHTYWRLDYPKTVLENVRETKIIVNVWGISLNGKIETEPTFEKVADYRLTPLVEQQEAKRLRWRWENASWDVIIDPMSDNPLIQAR